jgi:hypothetical protein
LINDKQGFRFVNAKLSFFDKYLIEHAAVCVRVLFPEDAGEDPLRVRVNAFLLKLGKYAAGAPGPRVHPARFAQ